MGSSEEVRSAGRLAWFREEEFLSAIKRIVQGACFIATFLVLEAILTTLCRLMFGINNADDLIVGQILRGIDIFSALGAATLFLIHTVKVGMDYIHL